MWFQKCILGEVCAKCAASKSGMGDYMAFEVRQPLRNDAAWQASVECQSLMCFIDGWDMHGCLGEAMHAGPLVLVCFGSASIIVGLCNKKHFLPHAIDAGCWQQRMQVQLDVAYVRFQLYLKDILHRESAQPYFTVKQFSMYSLRSFPFHKAKAMDALHIQAWLLHLFTNWYPNDHARTFLQGSQQFFLILRSSKRWLDDGDLDILSKARAAMLFGYRYLGRCAFMEGKARSPSEPKLHFLDHSYWEAMQTRENPGFYWVCSSEDS